MKSIIPADVPAEKESLFKENYDAITKQTGRLLLYACDQKIEHLNADFTGNAVHEDAAKPSHLFQIAQEGTIGAMAAHPGLITRYARDYNGINYIAKLNGKTSLAPHERTAPMSASMYHVDDVLDLIADGVAIRGVGVTIYIGSEREEAMLSFAAQVAHHAHQHGLVTVLWAYPRGPQVTDDQDPTLIAGAAGLGNVLGYDFVKVKPPHGTAGKTSAQHVHTAVTAAGNTGVICSGMSLQEPEDFLRTLAEQLEVGGTSGCATGRNIFQRSLPEAVAMTRAIAALVYQNASVEQAIGILT